MDSDGALIGSQDKFFILSQCELTGNDSLSVAFLSGAPSKNYEGEQYAFWANGNTSKMAMSSRAGYDILTYSSKGGQGSSYGRHWWQRSPYIAAGTSAFFCTKLSGDSEISLTSAGYGVVPAFSF